MASNPRIQVTIAAKDEATGTLNRVRAKMAALAASPQIAATQKRYNDMLATQQKQAAMLARSMPQRGLSAAGMLPGVGAIAGAASIAGVTAMIERYTTMGVTLGNTARRAGMSAKQLDGVRGAARMLGLSTETADQAVEGLNNTLGDAFFGRNAQAAAAMHQFGISLGSVDGGARKATDVLPEVADTVQRLARVDPRAALRFMSALGLSPDSLPLLMRGAQGFRSLTSEAERLSGITDTGQQSSERYAAAMGRMAIATDRVGRSIVTALEPHLTPMLDGLSAWVTKHDRDIGETFDNIGRAIEHIDWEQIRRGVEQAGKAAEYAAGRLERMWKFVQELDNFTRHGVQLPMSHFGSEQQRLLMQGGADQMRAGTLPGPEEGMSLPPKGAKVPPPLRGLPPAEQNRRAKAARDQLVALGWAPHQAAGIVANLFHESGMRADAVGDGGQAHGAAQWHPDRQANIQRQFGKPVESMSLDEQVRAVDWELRNTEKAAGDRIRATTNANDAGAAASRYYERPAAIETEALNRGITASSFDAGWAKDRTAAPTAATAASPPASALPPAATPAPASSPSSPSAAPAPDSAPSAASSKPQPDSDPWAAYDPDKMTQQQRNRHVGIMDNVGAILGGMKGAYDVLPNERAGGSVKIDINHNAVPESVNMRASAQGGAEIGGVRVERAMPHRSRRDDG